jgi:glycosyltransferase involved in cell wall biosynthesis
VGRLTRNKDPLTALDGLELALPHLPRAAVVMVFGGHELLAEVTERIQSSPVLGQRVTLVGEVPHDEMPNYYSAADVFISASHNEGSGYALIEALAASVIPVVTDIPPFRAITGRIGARYAPGDAAAFATALREVCTRDLAGESMAARKHFERELQWDAIAATTLSAYGELASQPRRSR